MSKKHEDSPHDTDTALITKPDPELKADVPGGYGIIDPSRMPDDFKHKDGDPLGDGKAQYGASPIREARYQDDHDAKAGKRHHRGVQPGKKLIKESGT